MDIRQIVMVSALRDPIVNNLCKLFECQVAFNDPDVGHFGLQNAVIPIGTDFLEVVSPKENNTAAGRYLKKRNGDGGYMVIIQVNDFMKAKKHVKKNDIDIVWESDHQQAKAIHLHPKQMGGAIVSLDWMNPKDSWKWAGPNWKEFVNTKRVKRIIGVEIQSEDPETLKNMWQLVLNVPEGKIGINEIHFDNTWIRFVDDKDGRGPGISAFYIEVNDKYYLKEKAKEQGLFNKKNIVIGGVRFVLV